MLSRIITDNNSQITNILFFTHFFKIMSHSLGEEIFLILRNSTQSEEKIFTPENHHFWIKFVTYM
jgi:hypothetical protein